MDNENNYVTYERRNASKHAVRITKLDSEPQPRNGFAYVGPATPEERDEEIARRAKSKAEKDSLEAMQARIEYVDASVIRSILEWMSPNDNPLDKLTPEEWSELRSKLER